MRDYTKIKAWQLADDLTVDIYKATKSFPKDEVYALTNQLRRAAYSVPSNIVEGSSRSSKKDYLHFLYIARGSLSETRYFVHLSQRLGYLTKEYAQVLASQAEEVSRTNAETADSRLQTADYLGGEASGAVDAEPGLQSAVCGLQSDPKSLQSAV
jgi:four helix bundle protein